MRDAEALVIRKKEILIAVVSIFVAFCRKHPLYCITPDIKALSLLEMSTRGQSLSIDISTKGQHI